MWQSIVEFFSKASLLELLLILVAKIIEVSISTLRVILVNKGYRLKATLLSFIEIMLWVFIASTVINGISEAPIKGIIYGIGFSIGVYLGSLVEAKLAFGQVLVQVITSEQKGILLLKELRQHKYGVTSVKAEGRDSHKLILMIFSKRKNKEHLVEIINHIDDQAMIVANDVNPLKGGYIQAAERHILK